MPLLTVSASIAASGTVMPLLDARALGSNFTRRVARLTRLSWHIVTTGGATPTFTVTETTPAGATRTLAVFYADDVSLGGANTNGFIDCAPGIPVTGAVTVTSSDAFTSAGDWTVQAQFDLGDDDATLRPPHGVPFAKYATLTGGTGLFVLAAPTSGTDDARLLVTRLVFSNTSASTKTGVVVSTRSTETGVIYGGTTAPAAQPLLTINVPAAGNTVVDLGSGIWVPKGMSLTGTPTVSTTSLFCTAMGYQYAPATTVA